MIPRRAVLLGLPLLAGCATAEKLVGIVQDVDVVKVASDIDVIARAVGTVKGAVSGLPAAARDRITALVDDVRAKAVGVVTAASKALATPLVASIEGDLRAVLDAGGPLLPKRVSGVVSDALTVLSAVKIALGVAALLARPVPAAAVAAARERLMVAR